MNESEGKIWVGFGVDNSELKKGVSEAKSELFSIGDAAEKSGGRVDEAFKVSGLRDLSTDIAKLNSSIEGQTSYVNSLRAEYSKLQQQAGAAFASGQDEAYRSLNDRMQVLNGTIREEEKGLKELSNQLNSVSIKQKEYEAEVTRSNATLEKQGSLFTRLIGGTEQYKAAFNLLPGPIKSTVSGILDMVKAARAFIATPLGAVLGAVVLALQALRTWFNSSAEGQMAFVKVSGYVSGVLGQLKEIVISVGKAIYSAFTDPQQAIKDLWEVLKSQVLTRIDGIAGVFASLGKVIYNAFSGDFEGVQKALTQLGNEALKTGYGVDNLAQKTKKYIKGLGDAAAATSRLRVEEEQLARDRSKFSVEEAKLRLKADEAFQRYQKSGSTDRKALKEYEEAVNTIYAQREKFAQDELRIKKELADITTNDQQAYDELYAAEAALIGVQSERIAALRRADRAAATLGRKDLQGEESAEKKAEKAYLEDLIENRKKLYDAEAAAQRAAITDKAKLREFDLQLALKAVEIEKQAFLKLAEAKGEKAPQTDIFERRKEALARTSALEAQKLQAEEDKAILDQYKTFTEQYFAKAKEFQDKKAAIWRAGGTAQNIEVAQKDYDQQLADLDQKFLEQTTGFETFADKIVGQSIDNLKKLIEKATQTLNTAGGDLTSESKEVLLRRVKAMQSEIDRLSRKPEKEKTDIEKWQKTQKVLSDIVTTSNSVIDGFTGIDEETKKVFKTITQVASGAISAIDGIKTFAAASNKAIASTGDAAQKSITAVEKASIILSIISAALQVITAIFDLFGGMAEKERKALEELTKAQKEQQEQYLSFLRQQALLAKEADTIFGADRYGKATAALKIYNEELDNLNKQTKDLLAGKNLKLFGENFAIGKIQVATGVRRTGFLGLGGLEDVYSNILDVFPNLIDKTGKFDKELAKTILSTYKMTDQSKMYLQSLINTADQVDAAYKALNDYLTDVFGKVGSTMMDSIVEAFKYSEKAGKNMINSLSSALEQLATDMLYSLNLQPIFDAAQKQIKDIKMKGLTPEEEFRQISKIIGQLAKEAKTAEAQMYAMMEQFQKEAAAEGLEIYKKESAKQGQATVKEAISITEETGSSLVGRITAIEILAGQSTDGIKQISDISVRTEPLITDIRDGIDILTLNSGKIREEVTKIREYSEALPTIEKHLSKMATSIEKL